MQVLRGVKAWVSERLAKMIFIMSGAKYFYSNVGLWLLKIHKMQIYRISSKSCCTSISRCTRNLAAYFSQLIPINAALKISLHGTGSTICVRARALYVHTNTEAVCVCVHVDLCRRRPRIVAA